MCVFCIRLRIPYSKKFSRGLVFTDRWSSNISRMLAIAPNMRIYKRAYFAGLNFCDSCMNQLWKPRKLDYSKISCCTVITVLLIYLSLSLSLSSIITVIRVDGPFLEQIRSYLNNDVTADVESMATPTPTLTYMKQLFAKDCQMLHKWVDVRIHVRTRQQINGVSEPRVWLAGSCHLFFLFPFVHLFFCLIWIPPYQAHSSLSLMVVILQNCYV